MKQFVQGFIGRALSIALMVVLVLPGLLLPAATRGLAASGGRQNILVLPFHATNAETPATLSSRIVRETQISLAGEVGVQVNELTRNSPLLMRAKDQLDDAGREALTSSYDVATNPQAADADRQQAAANLVSTLGVDAVVYGVIDQYEAESNPRCVRIHVTATKVAADKEGKPVTTPMVAIGKSRVRPDQRGSVDAHESEAIVLVARNLAFVLTRGKAPAQPVVQPTPPKPTETPKPPTKDKKSNNLLWILLGVAAVAALAGGGGGDDGGTPPVILEGDYGRAFSLANGVMLQFTRPTVTPAQPVKEYAIYRTLGTRGKSRGARAIGPNERPLLTLAPTDPALVTSGTTIRWTDTTVRDGLVYIYTIRATFQDGKTKMDLPFYNAGYPFGGTINPARATQLVGSGQPPAVNSITFTSLGGSIYRMSWTIPDRTLVTKFVIERTTDVNRLQGWTKIAEAGAGDSQLQLVVDGGPFFYRIIAVGVSEAWATYPGPLLTSDAVNPSTELQSPLNVDAVQPNPMSHAVTITWTAPTDTLVQGYRIYRKDESRSRGGRSITPITDFGGKLPLMRSGRSKRGRVGVSVRTSPTRAGNFVPIAVIASRATTFYQDTDAVDAGTYRYAVESLSNPANPAAGETSQQAESNAVLVDVAPGNVEQSTMSAVPGDRQIQLNWQRPDVNADGSPISMMTRDLAVPGTVNGGFRLYRLTAAPADTRGYSVAELSASSPIRFETWTTASGYSYTDRDPSLANRQTYYYAIVTMDRKSQLSAALYPYVSATPIAPPGSITLTGGSDTVVAHGPVQTLTATVKDADGLPLSGASVGVSCPATDGTLSRTPDGQTPITAPLVSAANGTVTFYYVPPMTRPSAGTATVTATLLSTGQSATRVFTITAPRADSFAITLTDPLTGLDLFELQARDSLTAPQPGSVGLLTVTAYDTTSVPGELIPVPGIAFNLACSDGTAGYSILSPISSLTAFNGAVLQRETGADGSYRLFVSSGERAGGQVTFTAVTRDAPLQIAAVDAQIIAGAPLAPQISLPPAINAAQTTGIITVVDANNNPVPNVTVLLTMTTQGGARGTIDPMIVTTDALGKAVFTLNMQPGTGAIIVNAGVGARWSATNPPIPVNIPVAANPELISGSLTVGAGSVNGYTWRLKKLDGTPLTNAEVKVRVTDGTLGGGTNEALLMTDALGNVSFNFTAPAISKDVTLAFFNATTNEQIGIDQTIHTRVTADVLLLSVNSPERIYYSHPGALDIGINVPRETTVVVSGTDLGVPAEGAEITLTTTKGRFIVGATAPASTVTVTLDAAGEATLRFIGDGTTVGSPDITLVSATLSETRTYSSLQLVGPPDAIQLTATGAQPGNPQILYQDQIMTLTGTVTDALGQPMVPGIPVWMTQSYVPLVGDVLSVEDYLKAVGAGNVRGRVQQTDDHGQISTGYSSNHSGQYALQGIVLKKNFSLTDLTAADATPNPPAFAAVANDLFTRAAGGIVTASLDVLNKTYPDNARWQVSCSLPGILYDGRQTARITLSGRDIDNKRILPGVTLMASSNIGKLELSSGEVFDAGVPVPMTFNERSEAFLLSRGDLKNVGQVDLTLDNGTAVNPTTILHNVLYHFGPALADAVLGSDTTTDQRIAGTTEFGDDTLVKDVVFTVTLADPDGNPYPDGLSVTVLEDGTAVGAPVALVDGQATLTYSSALPAGVKKAKHAIRVRVSGPDAGHASTTVTSNVLFNVVVVRPATAAVTPAPGTTRAIPLTGSLNVRALVRDEAIAGDAARAVAAGFTVKMAVVDVEGVSGATLDTPTMTTDTSGRVAATLTPGTDVAVVKVVCYYDLNEDDVADPEEILGESGNIVLGTPTVVTPNTVNVISGSQEDYTFTLLTEAAGLPIVRQYPITVSLVGEGTLVGTAPTATAINGEVTVTYQAPADVPTTMPELVFRDTIRNVEIGRATLTMQAAPPSAPTGVSAIVNGTTQITLTWFDVNGEQDYEIEHSTNGTTWGPGSTIAPQNAEAQLFTGLAALSVHYYRIRARNASGNSAWVEFGPVQAGLPWVGDPDLRVINFTSTSITLQWNDADRETSYEVWGSWDGVTNWELLGSTPPNVTQYVDTPLVPNTHHFYRVRIVLDQTAATPPMRVVSYSDWSNYADQNTAPAKPVLDNPNAVAADQIDVTWDAVEGAESYEIQYKTPAMPDFVTIPTPVFEIAGGKVLVHHTGLTENTNYSYRVRSLNGRDPAGTYWGKSDWSDPKSATTLQMRPVNNFKLSVMTANTNRIYYSIDPVDQLSATARLYTDMVVTGYTAVAGVNAVGVPITLTTTKGTFVKMDTDQTVTPDGKSITGFLDGNGEMVIRFQGRMAHEDTLVADDLGEPDITGKDENDAVLTFAGWGTPSYPVTAHPILVGPPFRIQLTTTGTAAGDRLPVLMQDATMTVTATVRDVAGQRVLSNMPIWFTQEWTQLDDLNDMAGNPDYYNQTVAEGNVRGPYALTDANGVTSAGFASHHSGVYDIHAFALVKDFVQADLDAISNWNPVETDQELIIERNMFITYTAGTAVKATTRVLNKTFAFWANWNITRVTEATLPAAPFNAQVNYDGSMTSRISFTASDEDGKKVLPKVPFGVEASLGKLELDNGTFVNENIELVSEFDESSEGYVLSRGNARAVGPVSLTFHCKNGTVDSRFTPTPAQFMLEHYALSIEPDPESGYDPVTINENDFNPATTELPNDSARIYRIAGSDVPTNIPDYRKLEFTITMRDQGGANYPDGIRIYPIIDNVKQTTPVILSGGSATYTYRDNLRGDNVHRRKIQFSVEAPVKFGVGQRIVPDPASDADGYSVNVVKPGGVAISLARTSMAVNSTLAASVAVTDTDNAPSLDGFPIDFSTEPLLTPFVRCNPALVYTSNGTANTVLEAGAISAKVRIRASYFNTALNNLSAEITIGAPDALSPNSFQVPTHSHQSYEVTLTSNGVPVMAGYGVSIVLNSPIPGLPASAIGEITEADSTVRSGGKVVFTYRAPLTITTPPYRPYVSIIDNEGNVLIGNVDLVLGPAAAAWTVPTNPKVGTRNLMSVRFSYGGTPVKNKEVHITVTGGTFDGASSVDRFTDETGTITGLPFVAGPAGTAVLHAFMDSAEIFPSGQITVVP